MLLQGLTNCSRTTLVIYFLYSKLDLSLDITSKHNLTLYNKILMVNIAIKKTKWSTVQTEKLYQTLQSFGKCTYAAEGTQEGNLAETFYFTTFSLFVLGR